MSSYQRKEDMIPIFLRSLFTIIFLLNFPMASYAVEVAPRISDREIIESLTELKIGQKNIKERFQSLQTFNQINEGDWE